MKVGRVVAGIIGALVALLAIGLLIGGTGLLWAYGTQRDADGFLVSPAYSLSTETHVLVSGDIDLGSQSGDWFPSGVATVRLGAVAADEALFVGIGPAADVRAYLAGVGQEEITRLGGRADDIETTPMDGGPPSTPPGMLSFWVASSEGTNAVATWEVERGDWAVVVMNADGSAPVDASFRAGIEIGLLLPLAIGLVVAGLLVAAGGAALLIWATRREREAVEAPEMARLPVALEGALDPDVGRWTWLIKWFLAIPHLVVLAMLWAAFAVLTVVAFFAILFTGRYPRGIFDFNVGVLRWTWRVGFYAFSALGTDRYPPFSLVAADYPARFDVAYPESLSRGLVLVKWWLLAIPHYLIVGVFTSGLVWWTVDLDGNTAAQVGGGLIGILVIVAALALGFTGRYPRGLFDLVMGLNRWVYRVLAYATLMRDEYPPFRLDLGGTEPTAGTTPPELGGSPSAEAEPVGSPH